MSRSARITAIAVAALAVATALELGVASSGDRSGCEPKRSRTVIETDDARVFTRQVPRHVRRSDPTRGTPRMYGCWFDHGQPYLLRSRAVADDARVQLAGRYVAYPWYGRDQTHPSYGRDDSVKLRVFDLRRGRLLRTAASYPSAETFFIESFVVNDRGSVAWIVLKSSQNPDVASRSVNRWDSNGLAQLDEDDRIYLDSLAIRTDSNFSDRDLIYWLLSGGAGEPRWAYLD